jgi:hypothetical protein
MSKQISIDGWVSIIPDKMYYNFVFRGFIKRGQTKIITTLKNEKKFKILVKEVKEWYNRVFEYVTKWLKANKFICLKKGSFKGGFCVEENANSDTVKHWGAPLADTGNKISQIKEKFGRITVYTNSLTDEQVARLDDFSKLVEKEFDCETYFF